MFRCGGRGEQCSAHTFRGGKICLAAFQGLFRSMSHRAQQHLSVRHSRGGERDHRASAATKRFDAQDHTPVSLEDRRPRSDTQKSCLRTPWVVVNRNARQRRTIPPVATGAASDRGLGSCACRVGGLSARIRQPVTMVVPVHAGGPTGGRSRRTARLGEMPGVGGRGKRHRAGE